MVALKIIKIGNSAGLVLPKEALARLRVEPGDTVLLTEAPDGYRITAHDPNFEHEIKLARRVMRKRKSVLRELAK